MFFHQKKFSWFPSSRASKRAAGPVLRSRATSPPVILCLFRFLVSYFTPADIFMLVVFFCGVVTEVISHAQTRICISFINKQNKELGNKITHFFMPLFRLEQGNTVIYAFGDKTNSLSYHGTSNRGSSNVNFLSQQKAVNIPEGAISTMPQRVKVYDACVRVCVCACPCVSVRVCACVRVYTHTCVRVYFKSINLLILLTFHMIDLQCRCVDFGVANATNRSAFEPHRLLHVHQPRVAIW